MGATGFIGKEIAKAMMKYGNKTIHGGVKKYKPGMFDVRGKLVKKQADLMSDDRINHMVVGKTMPSTRELLDELPYDHHVSADYLKILVEHIRNPKDIKTIINYIRSDEASNLTRTMKAEIYQMAADKAKWLEILWHAIN